MYVVFARKYRPDSFEEVVGQEHITSTLQNAVRTGRVAHAYLFCGSRGVGKTTVARILAKALNCKDGPTPEPCGECDSCRRISTGDDMDVMEIDGASNRGIDEVRDLRRNVRLAPAHSRFKIYYIDEVHMLTGEAFNALLKTLEEPPGHVKFIFSTTDPQKLPETVRSRCQRFDFRRIPDSGIVRMLEQVCEAEGLDLEEGVAAVIARAARGGMRDALGTLDQLAAFGDRATMEDVLTVLGAVDRRVLARIVDCIAREDPAEALREAHAVLFSGTDPEDFADQLSEYLRDVLVASYCGADDPMLAGAMVSGETLAGHAEIFTADQLTYMIQLLREAKLRARRDTTGRMALELALIKMSRLSDLESLQDAVEQLSGLTPAAPPAKAGNPGPGAVAESRDAAAAAPSQGAGGALSRMKERLKNGRRNASAAAPPPRGGAGAVREPGGSAAQRDLKSRAEDAEVAREAMDHEPLRKAFEEGDQILGLRPIRLERTGTEAAEGDDEDASGDDSDE
jgi:DNA polymerase-3 subunit gamma/tau